MLPEYFAFSLPTKVVYGIGIVNNLPSEISFLGPRRAILVTDKVLAKTAAVKQALKSFKTTAIDIVCRFDRVPPNSTVSAVKSCARMARKNDCDLFLAVGGGSVLDTAKVANLLAIKGGRLENHMGAYLLDKSEQLHPAIFAPTTAGTGSEVTKVAVIMDPVNNVKLPFTEDQFLPALAVLDPELTATMPGKLTAATGMDALTHAIEAYVDLEKAPPSDALALHAVKLISAHILRACAHPDDLHARGAMLTGSFLAGLAFSHSMVGMAHGIAHALGGVYNIPHGLANALVLPEVMTYNLDGCLERYADIAVAMGVSYPQVVADGQSLVESGGREWITPFLPPIGPVHHWVDRQSNRVRRLASQTLDNFKFVDQWVRKQTAKAGIDRIRLLNRQLAHLTGMPLNLRSAGITDNLAKLEQVVTKAMEDGAMLYNPVEPDRKAVRTIIKKVYRIGTPPLPVSEAEIAKAAGIGEIDSTPSGVFEDTEMLYEVLGRFYESLAAHPRIGPAFTETGLCVQFIYRNPAAVITVDATGKKVLVRTGKTKRRPEVIMTMDADFAHKFWHGKVNLLSALTRRQVTAKGNVSKTLKLLPVLKPAYALYPQYLRENGWEHLVMI